MAAQLRTLESFGDFSRLMNELPYLEAVEAEQRKKLIRELYEAAQATITREEVTEYARQGAKESREGRRRLSHASSLLRHALQDVRKAREDYGTLLEDIESMNSEVWGFTLAEIEEHLKTSVDFVTSYECLNAALVHPKLRTPLERKLARQQTPAFGELTEEAEDHVPYPLGEKSLDIDRWLIRKAAACLDKYRTTKNRNIQRYDTIIAKLFKAAFGSFRSEDSVRKTLHR
jgi:hypothetical protein